MMTDERDRLLAEKARIEAELAKLDAETDWEAWRPALEAFYSLTEAGELAATPFDEEDKDTVRRLIAAAPLMPRDAGMSEEEIGLLAREFAANRGMNGASNLVAIRSDDYRRDLSNAIRETLKRAPQVRWPGEDELREMATAISEIYGPYGSAMQMARLIKAHLTGEGK